MANKVYPKFKKALLDGNAPDLLTVDVKIALIALVHYRPT